MENMDYYPNEHARCFHNVFRTFVCVVLSLLLGLQAYSYFAEPQDALEGEFKDVKYMVMQLTRGLTEETVTQRRKQQTEFVMENMDYYPNEHARCFHNVFRTFVCVVLSLLLGLQAYSYFAEPQDALEGEFKDVKYMVMQLTRGLTEVNRKHETLQREMERIAAAFPAVAAAAGRAKDALEPARPSVRHPLDVHDYDRQMADYALETAGARVVDTGETVEHIVYESPVSWALHMISAAFCRECPGAGSIIRPGALPGECWAFRGTRGEATIRLLGTVHVHGVSLEHIPPHISPTREISSAPRLFQLEGLEFRGDPYAHDFGTFEYDKDGKPIQYFEVLHPSQKGFSLVRLKIYTNWGHSVYTCVYRVRIHGELVSDQSRPTALPVRDDGLRIENE